MRRKYTRFTAFLIMFCVAFSSFSATVSALEWDGSSTGGGGNGTSAGPNGYAIRTTDENCCVGYRFSIVDKSGNMKGNRIIDVFRNSNAYNNNYSFTNKLNKKQLINGQNNSYSTSKSTYNCYMESSMGFTTSLPHPSGMGTWQNYTGNLNAVLASLGAGNINNLKNGDKILVEPLWDVRLQSVYHSLTVTELSIYGKWILGANSDGGSSSTSESWGFISSYTNRHFPNHLYTPDGQGLWSGVGGLSSRATFYNLINSGYGVGIAYTETKPDFSPNLSVNICEVWQGAAKTYNKKYGTSNGASFGNYTYSSGYPIMGDTVWFAVNFPAESENCYVRQTVWIVGGGSVSRNVYSNSNTWYDVSLSPTTVDAGRSSYVVKARVDWIDGSGNVLKWGVEKTFYVPVRPKINRYQVTMYDITNTQAARNGSAGSSGSVYVGQKVYPKYTYTSSSTWTSSNNFSNTINGVTDLNISANINNNSAVERYSSYSPYVVPNVSSLPCVLITSWSSDSGRTRESTNIPIPVVKADVELKEIRLIDATTGAYVSGNKLWVHQKVVPQYVYKNNTGIKVYVEGYDNDRSRISGIYAIPAYGEIYVNGKQITIPNVTSTSVWGGVYLDGAGIYNTSWESGGSNNAKTVTYAVEHPLAVQPITPNSLYRETTEVMSSFRVQNYAPFPFTPDYNIIVRFTASNGGTVLYTTTKSAVVIPANGDNLVYFRWTVPSGLNGTNVTLKAEIIDGGKVIDTKSFVHGTEKKPVSQTPDTVFEKSAPAGFSVISPPVRTDYKQAQWSEWVYQNNSFVKRTYGLNLNTASLPVIVPDVNSPSREYKNGSWTMKSGYGFTANWSVGLQTLSGTTAPTTAMYTNSQMAFMYFPEFKYNTATNSFRVLDRTAAKTFQLPVNPNGKDARLHFVPLWFPNTNYRTQGYVGDIWTPAGMISGYMNSAPIVISQSAYDDWVIGR